MKLDSHVHTAYSGFTTIRPLARIMRESYNSVDGVYRRAKARGMDLVAITDHDTIEGALTIADRPDVIVGCEVTGVFPHDGVRVHLGVLGLDEAQHREIDRLRHDVRELLPYLNEQGLFVSLNHVASRINGPISAAHVVALMPWVNGLEIRNGSRLPCQNRTAEALAAAYRKVGVAGSDSHTHRGIGRTWIEAHGVTTREAFLAALHAGRVSVGGGQGHYFTMASDIFRMSVSLYKDRLCILAGSPTDWHQQALLVCGLFGLPLLCAALATALGHFILEERFNRSLLVDLVARPSSIFEVVA